MQKTDDIVGGGKLEAGEKAVLEKKKDDADIVLLMTKQEGEEES